MSDYIEQQFQSLRKMAFPTVQGSELRERRMMFFAGFHASMTASVNMTDEQIEAHVDAVDKEVKAFFENFAKGLI